MRRALGLLAALSTALSPIPVANATETGEVRHVSVNLGGEDAGGRTVVLSLNKAVIVDLPVETRDVLLSNPEIAEAVVRTPRRVYVLGRKVGLTNAFFFDAAGRQIANLEIRVEPDVAPLNDLFRRYVPNTNAKAEAVNGSLVLSGAVRSASEAERVLQIASRYIQSKDGGGGAAAAGGSGGASGVNPNIVNLLAVQGQEQVLVKVRIVEMSRSLVRQLGVNLNYEDILNQMLPTDTFVRVASQNGYSIAGRLLGGVTATGGVADTILQPSSLTYGSIYESNSVLSSGYFGHAGAAPVSAAGVSGYSQKPLLDATGGIMRDPSGNPIYEYTFGGAKAVSEQQVDASIEAFERVGLLRVLAEPNLTAISGESAKFLAGGEFPIPVRAKEGEISVEFKPFGVGLAFTPVVLSEGRISLKLSTEVSELTSDGAFATGDASYIDANGQRQIVRGITIPALQVRRAETTVEMPSGGALVMAGLIQERTRQAIEGLPGAKDLPVLGQLFRSRDFASNETELVIIVTPYLVQATSPDKLKTPSDGFRVAGEGETLLTGRLNALYAPPTGEKNQRGLKGPHGHVIEGSPSK